MDGTLALRDDRRALRINLRFYAELAVAGVLADDAFEVLGVMSGAALREWVSLGALRHPWG